MSLGLFICIVVLAAPLYWVIIKMVKLRERAQKKKEAYIEFMTSLVTNKTIFSLFETLVDVREKQNEGKEKKDDKEERSDNL